MSATLATLLSELEPSWRIEIVERLDGIALESTDAWNNAGTGHAALCELNYTPERADGTIEIGKAVTINKQFALSCQLWDHLVDEGRLPHDGFRSPVPHLTFVRGADDVDYLRRRYAALSAHPRFAHLEYSEDPETIASWAPLVMADRAPDEPVAATRATDGLDVDFGTLTRLMVDDLVARGTTVRLQHEVRRIRRRRGGGWRLQLVDRAWNASPRRTTLDARFVFIGAGGGALRLLQASGIDEIKGYGGFPISGQFLRTTDPALVEQHRGKVYGKAAVGSPPMSVPHLDTRVVAGQPALMFGPYAGWSMKFLKAGSWTDLIRTVRPGNLVPLLAVALHNLDLLKYLVSEVLATRDARLRTLRGFMPAARDRDWEMITAGQRVQVIKRGKGGGVLEFGTELITSADGSIAGLLGASPGASTAASAMLDLLRRCFPDRFAGWRPRLEAMMPQLAETAARGTGAAPGGGEAPDADPDLETDDPTSPADGTEGVGYEPGPEPRPAVRRPARPTPPRRRDTPVA
ncbi:putative malate:quinone oxidoreductase [Cellulomonas pakistanensis]|uniref:Probable malate:quinone oxidoreductase n=2 Tax=Cellulomonas pakistanensis TaxID=992287 RepID=A0A919P6I2_9CELL|nr:putative malate:quinone oxidoreductase [Cellulomonas pakistanensis]